MEVAYARPTLEVRVDQDEVVQAIYMPALAAACGVVSGREDLPGLREIRVVNAAGASGWVYEGAANCQTLISTPPALMRLAIAAESMPYVATDGE